MALLVQKSVGRALTFGRRLIHGTQTELGTGAA